MSELVAALPPLATSTLEPGTQARIKVPASTANLGPGFDSLGMALGVWDDAQAEVIGNGLTVVHTGHGEGEVPLDENHLVYRAMLKAWEALGVETPSGLTLTYTCSIPHSRGMGSSASAIVAGVALASALAGYDLEDGAVLAFVSDVASSMEGHPDNASASVYGGATISWADDAAPEGVTTWRTTPLDIHEDITPLIIVPEDRLDTATARSALSAEIPLPQAARNSGRAALLSYALMRAPRLLLPATRDYLHQEARRPSYPASMALVDELREAGIAAVISGAGPTVLALATASQLDAATAIADGREVLTPGIPDRGVYAVSQ